ncbi:UNVERIFIED_CONTAM: hypothetical protein FKN15_050165 [Acipenser sinensis]
MARQYQNGEAFGYILAFRKKADPDWRLEKVANVESSRFMYRNETTTAYCPFEVKIKGYNRKGEGPFSQTVLIYSAEEEPTVAPRRVNASSMSAFEMLVSWDPVQNLSLNGVLRGYEIRYWRKNDNEAAADRVRTAGLETSARVSGLRPSTLYHVAVLAYNSAGTGPPSPTTTTTTKKPPPSQEPGNVSWRSDGSWVTVAWDPVKALKNESAVMGYKILYKQEGQAVLKVLDKGKTSIQLPLPRDNSYAVLEIRAWGEGGDGAPKEVIVSRDSGTGMMVQNSATEHTPLHTVFSTTLIRYWRKNDNEAAADRVRTAGLETSARVSGLRPSTLYHVAVLAYNSAGTGPPSPTTTTTTKKPPPSQEPGNVSWRSDGSWVTVAWDPVKALKNESAVMGYKILYKQEGQAVLKVLDKGKTSIQLPLPRDNSYAVLEIRAWGEGGDGAPKEVIVSRDSGTGMMVQNSATEHTPLHTVFSTTLVMLALIGLLEH